VQRTALAGRRRKTGLNIPNFLTQVINDARANGMTGSDVRWDMWNEPTSSSGAGRQAQYLEMIRRGNACRSGPAFPNAVIEGPSFAGRPPAGPVHGSIHTWTSSIR